MSAAETSSAPANLIIVVVHPRQPIGRQVDGRLAPLVIGDAHRLRVDAWIRVLDGHGVFSEENGAVHRLSAMQIPGQPRMLAT